MPFNYLPGVQVYTVDGGLVARRAPTAKSLLIVGTAGQGPTFQPYQVIDRSAAALAFGLEGNLVKSMEEAAGAGTDNIILYRMGATPMKLKSVGAVAGDAGTPEVPAVVATITAVAIDTNVATLTCTNTFAQGNTVALAGLIPAELAGSFVIASRTGSEFTVAVTASDYPEAPDNGTATKAAVPAVPASLSGGTDITFGEITADAADRYQIWQNDGKLVIWLDGAVVYSNDSDTVGLVDTQDCSFSADPAGVGVGGLQLGTGGTPSLSAAVTITEAEALTPAGNEVAVTIVDPVVGTSMTNRAAFLEMKKALELLQIFPVDMVMCPSATIDCANVAHKDSATNAKDVLGWLKTTVDADGNKAYQWHDETKDDQGATVTAMVAATPAARLLAGFHEVSFAYELAKFCKFQGQNLGGCVAFIATKGPVSFKLTDTRSWVGHLPTYNAAGSVTASGKGLLGIPELVGCSTDKLAALCADYSLGGRIAGYFDTNTGEYDGTPTIDNNGYPVDMGAYLHVAGDQAIFNNGYAANYQGNICAAVAGLCASLDEKRNLTNKVLNVIQLWKPAQSQMDALTFAKVNVLRYKGLNLAPVLLHGFTAAHANSDYTNLLRVRIKFMVVRILFAEADKFVGEAAINGLTLAAMKTALENKVVALQKGGYVSSCDFKIDATISEQRLGKGRIYIKFSPADELVQLSAFIGIGA